MATPSDDCMHIGNLARQAGTTTRTVRYYEEMGLLRPEYRSKGGFRCYSEEQLDKLQMILSLKELEFDLEQIRAILGRRFDCSTGGELASGILQDLKCRLDAVNQQVAHYTQLRSKLTRAVDNLCQCLPCECREQERLCADCEVLCQDARDPLPYFHQIKSN